MEEINLKELFNKQKELDATIAKNHNVTYASTRNKRILSLLVEVSELANATRCFKYWSNKASESNERILDEYADGLHFLLSLGIDIKTNKMTYFFNEKTSKNNPTDQFLFIFNKINEFSVKQDENTYIESFESYLNLLPLLGFTWLDAEKAYYTKLGENYHRQETNY